MSKEFIEGKFGSKSLHLAQRQARQLDYFTTSSVQEDFNIDYFENYATKKYYNADQFLNWTKLIFKTKNFLSFAKHFRNPNPASKLIQTEIAEDLTRVFFSEDSHFNYIINNEKVPKPTELNDGFDSEILNDVLFNYNNILVHDLSGVNTPYRYKVDIKNVVSIETRAGDITRIAYTGRARDENGVEVEGYVYLDDTAYELYDKDFKRLNRVTHDLGMCPAVFINYRTFGKDPIVKKSIFSYLRADLEEYCFLKTLQRMVDAKGTVPVVVKIKTQEKDREGSDIDAADQMPLSMVSIGNQQNPHVRQSAGTANGSTLEAGTLVEVPAIEKEDGSIDTDLAREFMHFHYIPVEALEFLNKRTLEVESKIVLACVGDSSESKTVEGSKSTEEIEAVTITSKENKLRSLSHTMSKLRNKSDYIMLSLSRGPNSSEVDVFYGSDFFLESTAKLYQQFRDAPNSIERSNILRRLSQRRNMFNKSKGKREYILYLLLPYPTDMDFDKALTREGIITDQVFILQTQFQLWISKFEATYGDIVLFWDALGDDPEATKAAFILELITNLMQNNNE